MKEKMEKIVQEKLNPEAWFMYEEERRVFERSISRLPHPSIFSSISRQDLDYYSKLYLVRHNLYHQEIKDSLISLAEVKISLKAILDLLEEFENTKIAETCIHLSLLLIEENPGSVYTVSKKVLMGEFIERGGLEPGVWGWKPKIDVFPETVNCLKTKMEKNSLEKLIERYQNLKIQELLPPLHL